MALNLSRPGNRQRRQLSGWGYYWPGWWQRAVRSLGAGLIIIGPLMELQGVLIWTSYTVFSPQREGLEYALDTGGTLIHQRGLAALGILSLGGLGILLSWGWRPLGLEEVVWTPAIAAVCSLACAAIIVFGDRLATLFYGPQYGGNRLPISLLAANSLVYALSWEFIVGFGPWGDPT